MDTAYLIFKDFQTLIAGMLALLGAVLTVRVVRRQIDQSVAETRERLERRNRAARAVLPLALSEFSEYAQQSADALMKLHEEISSVGLIRHMRELPERPSFPHDALPVVQSCIEAADAAAAEAMGALLVQFQIQNARLRDTLSGGNATPRWIEQQLLDAAELHARTSLLFRYARDGRSTPKRDPAPENIEQALKALRVEETEFSDVYSRATNWKPRPWVVAIGD